MNNLFGFISSIFGNSPSPPESVGGTNAVSEQQHQSGSVIIDLTEGENTENQGISDGFVLDFNDEDIEDLLQMTANADSLPIDGVLSDMQSGNGGSVSWSPLAFASASTSTFTPIQCNTITGNTRTYSQAFESSQLGSGRRADNRLFDKSCQLESQRGDPMCVIDNRAYYVRSSKDGRFKLLCASTRCQVSYSVGKVYF